MEVSVSIRITSNEWNSCQCKVYEIALLEQGQFWWVVLYITIQKDNPCLLTWAERLEAWWLSGGYSLLGRIYNCQWVWKGRSNWKKGQRTKFLSSFESKLEDPASIWRILQKSEIYIQITFFTFTSACPCFYSLVLWSQFLRGCIAAHAFLVQCDIEYVEAKLWKINNKIMLQVCALAHLSNNLCSMYFLVITQSL